MAIKLLIGCRMNLLAEGVKKLLEGNKEIRVVGTADSMDKLVERLKSSPDVVLADQCLCKDLFRIVKGKMTSKILCINGQPLPGDPPTCLKNMLSRGLAGVLSSDSDVRLLKKAIKSVHHGDLWIDHNTIKNTIFSKNNTTINITSKESEILNYICEGLSNKEIAQKLFISEQTVKTHCNHIYKKFGVKNRVKLALRALNMKGDGLL